MDIDVFSSTRRGTFDSVRNTAKIFESNYSIILYAVYIFVYMIMLFPRMLIMERRIKRHLDTDNRCLVLDVLHLFAVWFVAQPSKGEMLSGAHY